MPTKNRRHFQSHWFFGTLRISVRSAVSYIRIADHVEVVVVDINDFDAFLVIKGVRNRPAVDGPLFEVDRALVVSVVKLCESDQWHESRLVHVVRNLAFDNADPVALLLVQKGNTATDGASSLQRMNDFVVTRWIDRRMVLWTTRQRTHDGDSSVTLMNVELDFFAVLKVGGNRNGKSERPQIHVR